MCANRISLPHSFLAPHLSHSITIKHKSTGNLIKSEKIHSFPPDASFPGEDALPPQTTYGYQLMAFRDRVKGIQREDRGWVDVDDSVAQMEVIDEIYKKAGMVVRNGSLWAEMKKKEKMAGEESGLQGEGGVSGEGSASGEAGWSTDIKTPES